MILYNLTLNSSRSTHKSLDNIIKIQGVAINSLQQELVVFESKFLFLEELLFNDNLQLNNQSINIFKDNSIVHSTRKPYESSSSDQVKGSNQPYENCKSFCIPPEISLM